MSNATCLLGSASILLLVLSPARSQELQHRPAEQNPRVVVCKVMETHASREPAVSVAVFHQRDKADAERLKELLQKSVDGGAVEFQVSGAAEWRAAAVARLKSCFGRGLLIVPTGVTAPAAGTIFLLRFPVSTLKSEPGSGNLR